MSVKIFSYPELIKNFPAEVKLIFKIFLEQRPDAIRLVGGCVRDMLLGFKAKDFDFATKFLPQDTMRILQENNIHAVPTGIKFGTITAVINHQHFEITTLRKDSEHDGRHCEPEFIDDYFFDAARRDFTMNALYLDNKGVVHDYFDGISDLKNRKVKFIGDANERIQEDYLRILRFFRFSCRYAASLDREGLRECIANKNGIAQLSADRIRNEIFKTFEGSSNERLLWIFQEIENSQIGAEIFSAQFQITKLQKLFEIEKFVQIKFSDHLKFAALVFAPNINLQEILLRLNFSNNEKDYYNFIYKTSLSLDFKALRQMLVFEKKEFVRDLFLLKSDALNGDEIIKSLNYVDNFSLPIFPLSGDDLIAQNITGKKIGEVLLMAKKEWIESDFTLDKKSLLEIIKTQAW